jgi:glycosyltransferase involved in cell wall biosynthesis
MLACHRRDIPYCSISQLNTSFTWPTDQNVAEITKAFTHAQKCFFVSEGILRLFEKQIGEELHNSSICGNPVHPSVTPNNPPSYPNLNGIWNLAVVARLYPSQKGHDLLFDAISSDCWRNRPVKFNLFGDGDKVVVQKLAKMHRLSNVEFCGVASNIRTIWEKNHILVLPSRFEGLPLALVEAMFCCRAAIVTDVPGNRDVVTDGYNGFLAASASAKHISEVLELAWTRRDQWEAMGVNAYNSIKQSIGLDPIGKFVDAIEAILSPATSTNGLGK